MLAMSFAADKIQQGFEKQNLAACLMRQLASSFDTTAFSSKSHRLQATIWQQLFLYQSLASTAPRSEALLRRRCCPS